MKRKLAYFAAPLVLAVVALFAQLTFVPSTASTVQGGSTPECEACKAQCQQKLDVCDQGPGKRGPCVKEFERCVREDCAFCPPGHNRPEGKPPTKR